VVNFYQRQLACMLLIFTPCMAAAQHTESDLQDSIPDSPSSAITARERLAWIVKGTVGPRSLATGIFTAGIQTAQNRPREYGPHWEGFGKRYGIQLTGIATERVMEASLGALWGEDPRYFRTEDRAFQDRMKNIVLMTVVTRRADGSSGPAYARFIAMPASNFLSNTWRADSIANSKDALGRTLLGFVGKLAGNAFAEFWPDVKKGLHPKKGRPDPR
jgi:hypothetical protein